MKRFAKVGMAKIEISTEDGGGRGVGGGQQMKGYAKVSFVKVGIVKGREKEKSRITVKKRFPIKPQLIPPGDHP